MQSSVSGAVATWIKLKHGTQGSTGSSTVSRNSELTSTSSAANAFVASAMTGLENCSSAIVIGSVLAAVARGSCGSAIAVVQAPRVAEVVCVDWLPGARLTAAEALPGSREAANAFEVSI